jgi:hypothetical protein
VVRGERGSEIVGNAQHNGVRMDSVIDAYESYGSSSSPRRRQH